jgi:hypothetical protein
MSRCGAYFAQPQQLLLTVLVLAQMTWCNTCAHHSIRPRSAAAAVANLHCPQCRISNTTAELFHPVLGIHIRRRLPSQMAATQQAQPQQRSGARRTPTSPCGPLQIQAARLLASGAGWLLTWLLWRCACRCSRTSCCGVATCSCHSSAEQLTGEVHCTERCML